MNRIFKEWVIYNNIIGENGFFHYRHVKFTGNKLTEKEFDDKLRRDKYFIIPSEVLPEYKDKEHNYLHIKPIYIIIFNEDNPNISRTVYINGIANKLESILKKQKKDGPKELIFIGKNPPKKNTVDTLKAKGWFIYEYTRFAIKYPICTQCSHHEIIKPEFAKKILKRFRYESNQVLPKIPKNDTMMVWIGAKPGDIILIRRYSENTLETVEYRYVSNISLVPKK